MNALALYCRLVGHKFSRAKKGQDPDMKHCRRCGTMKPIKRKAKA